MPWGNVGANFEFSTFLCFQGTSPYGTGGRVMQPIGRPHNKKHQLYIMWFSGFCCFLVISEIHSYPSGRLAVSIVAVRSGLFTYILQKDVPAADVVAIFQPTGHGIIYYDDGLPRCNELCCFLCLMKLSTQRNQVYDKISFSVYEAFVTLWRFCNKFCLLCSIVFMTLVGRQEGHLACRNCCSNPVRFSPAYPGLFLAKHLKAG